MRLNIIILVAVAGALLAIVAAVVVGLRVREDTVVARPYEDGQLQAADRIARARLRWEARISPEGDGEGGLLFTIVDGDGRPIEGAQVVVGASPVESSRGLGFAAAAPRERGQYTAKLDLHGEGPFLFTFDVKHGEDALRIERIARGPQTCSLERGPCTRVIPGDPPLEVTFELGPRPLRSLVVLQASATVRAKGAPVDIPGVRVELTMPGMFMGENVVTLAPDAPGRYRGRLTVLPCLSGRRDYSAEISPVPSAQGAWKAAFPLTVGD